MNDQGKVAQEPVDEKNLDGYGAPPISWEKVRERLDRGIDQEPGGGGPDRHTSWLATVNADGSPHVVPVGVMWVDGAFYFTSGDATRKSRNLAQNPRAVISVATHDFDLVFEGEASKITDRATAGRIAELYGAQGWEATLADGTAALTAPYSAPSAGPPPWDVYRLVPETVYAFGTAEPYGATKWSFE
jgi:nitroimidazol reductase NimA-like FMN-containing flavoprotein (pyridoxamine 5'-phosphate oxidase superfamily)